MRSRAFVERQRRHYRQHDPRHFAWQTEAPYFAATEAALLDRVTARPGERLLEIGCGEGANLHHVGRRSPGAIFYGVDFSPAKAAFARTAAPAHTACADAARLPFADESFDVVLIRDLLHHLPDRRRALDEARRVLKPGGRLTLIEPNRRAPLVLLQAALEPAERGLLRSTVERLRHEVDGAGFRIEEVEERQPFPIFRLVLHDKIGRPSLGARPKVAWALDRFDDLMRRAMPRRAWLYLVLQATRP